MNAKALGHFLHRLLVDKHGAKSFVTLLDRIVGLQKERLIGLAVHGYLRSKCLSIFFTESPHYAASPKTKPSTKTPVGPQIAGKNARPAKRRLST